MVIATRRCRWRSYKNRTDFVTKISLFCWLVCKYRRAVNIELEANLIAAFAAACNGSKRCAGIGNWRQPGLRPTVTRAVYGADFMAVEPF